MMIFMRSFRRYFRMNCELSLMVSTLLSFNHIVPSIQHARLMEPPSRASMWRLGFNTAKNIDDNQVYCGGYSVQHAQNGGRCGICGDAWNLYPRPHEAPGGKYANGIITKSYKQGSVIPVIVDVTANHQGYFVFKLCINNNLLQDSDQQCFERQPPLQTLGTSSTTFHGMPVYAIYDYQTGLRLLYLRLPKDVTCEQCIFQWTYVAGNNWGDCGNGTSGLGCGPQETFRACSDIKITAQESQTTLSIHENQHDVSLIGDILEHMSNHQVGTSNLLEKKLAQLTRKKELLRKALMHIRQIIIQSNSQGEDYDHQSTESSTRWKHDKGDSTSVFDKFKQNPWLLRFGSNRH